MAWQLLKISAAANTAENLSDTLMAMGALSASIEDAHANTPDEQAIFGEPGDPPPGIWDTSIVSALFDENVNIDDIMRLLEREANLKSPIYNIELIAEQDWVRATQSQFDPIKILDNLWIVPTWHTPPNAEAINIILDPGLAFGTGSHPTTHLCLEWLTQNVSATSTVLDYGCGSGILAIAAKKLGAKTAAGIDIDAQAIQASDYNALQNHVEAQFYMASQHVDMKFDTVVANILSSALMVLAPILAQFCKSGGKIALSGILPEQVAELLTRYSEWFNMHAPQSKDGWMLLTGSRL